MLTKIPASQPYLPLRRMLDDAVLIIYISGMLSYFYPFNLRPPGINPNLKETMALCGSLHLFSVLLGESRSCIFLRLLFCSLLCLGFAGRSLFLLSIYPIPHALSVMRCQNNKASSDNHEERGDGSEPSHTNSLDCRQTNSTACRREEVSDHVVPSYQPVSYCMPTHPEKTYRQPPHYVAASHPDNTCSDSGSRIAGQRLG